MTHFAPTAIAGLALALLSTTVPSQAGPARLSQLAKDADAVATARVLLHQEGSRRVLHLRTLHCLKGSLPEILVLTEPGGNSCGRALSGLPAGLGCLLFLRSTPSGPRLLLSTEAAIQALEPGLVDHVRSLLAGETDLPALLVDGLASISPRVRRDSASDLAQSPDLHRITAAQRQRIRDALHVESARPQPRLRDLVRIAARLRDAEQRDLLEQQCIMARPGPRRERLARALRVFDQASLQQSRSATVQSDRAPTFRSIDPSGSRR